MSASPITDTNAAAESPASPEKLSPAEAKARLMEIARSVDLLKPAREHPYVVIGVAAAAGAVLGGSTGAIRSLTGLTGSLLKLVGPVSSIIAQVAAAKVAAESVKDDSAPADAPHAESVSA